MQNYQSHMSAAHLFAATDIILDQTYIKEQIDTLRLSL